MLNDFKLVMGDECLKRIGTGAALGGLKLQCITVATFSSLSIVMPRPTNGRRSHYVFRLSVVRLSYPLIPISNDAVFSYLVNWFQWNLPQIFFMWMGVKKFFKVRGQRSRSWPGQLTYNGEGVHFDGVSSRLTTCLSEYCFWLQRYLLKFSTSVSVVNVSIHWLNTSSSSAAAAAAAAAQQQQPRMRITTYYLYSFWTRFVWHAEDRKVINQTTLSESCTVCISSCQSQIQ